MISKSAQGFQRRRFFKEFLHVRIVQKVSSHGVHVFGRIKILQTNFEKSHPRNNPVKLFQNLTSGFRVEEFTRISLKSTQWKKPPPMAAMFFDRSKFRKKKLKRVTQRTILWNYFKFWHAVSEEKNFEKFLWSPHSEKGLRPWRPCFSTDQNFANNFWKRSSKDHSREIISNSDTPFQRRRILKNFSEVHTVKKDSPSCRPCFSTDQNFANIIWKGSPKEQSSEII